MASRKAILRLVGCDTARYRRVLSLYAGKLRWRATAEYERIGGMRRIGRRRRALLWGAGIIMLPMLCVLASYASYNGGLVESIGAGAYQNTSAPLSATRDGVTISIPHSRYLTVETITLKLTNQSSTPIYMPGFNDDKPSNGQYLSILKVSIRYACRGIRTDFRGSGGQHSVGWGCYGLLGCPGGTPPLLVYPATLVIAPGQTVDFPLYDGEDSYPPWSPGAYQFSILFARTPFAAPQSWPLTIPQGEQLAIPSAMVTSAWWIPPHYHQTSPCPFAQ